MPEVGGRVDWHAEDHEQTMLALGLSSKREIARTRILKVTKSDAIYPDGAVQVPKDGPIQKGDEVRRTKP